MREYHHYPLAFNAADTLSAVTGKSVMRTPTASNTALAMAPATGMLLLSPMLLAFNNARLFARSVPIVRSLPWGSSSCWP